MSYSLYLVHQPLVQVLSYLIVVHGHATPRLAFVAVLICLPILFLVAWVLFVTVERRTLGTHQSPEVAFLVPARLDAAVARARAAVGAAFARVWHAVPRRWRTGVRAPGWVARSWRVRLEYRIAAAAMAVAVAAILLLGPLSALRPVVHAAVHTAGRDLRAVVHPSAHEGTPASTQPTTASSAPTTALALRGTPLISAGVPAYASSTYNPASDANDLSYDTEWRSLGVPAWLAYDLSSVSTAQRSTVLVVWYNGSYEYDNTVIKMDAYNCPRDYTIDVNAASGGGAPPTTGWVTRVTVTGNARHSRQHIIDMRGYNWVRVRATAVDGTTYNEDIALNMDVYTAGPAVADDWIFYGDSITAGGMNHDSVAGVTAFTQLIHAANSRRYPAAEDGGIPGFTSADGARLVPEWLPLFPGKYVGLSYGTNDASGCVDPRAFYANYVTMVRAVLAAGKVPIVPHIPWGRTANIQHCAPGLNAQIDRLYRAFPQIARGPDLWAYFQSHPDLISEDGIHPNNRGYGALRQQWAAAMLKTVER
jgi:lysophospholipase L1-like esterase